MMRLAVLAAVCALSAASPAFSQSGQDNGDIIDEVSLGALVFGPFFSAAEAQAAMTRGRISSEDIIRSYIGRIAEIDDAGPALNAVIAINPNALADARKLDRERAAGKVRGPLHGVPILIKDNIESWDGTATTAGSLALVDNIPQRDAPLVRRLTDAGAVILGKANLSEWANFRSTRSISGWSAVGGLVKNPYALDRNACGSSSGSAVAVAAGLASAAIGTETSGSLICPATMNGVVSLKPTLGLVSRTYIVPISPEQDTAGPMTRTVADTAAVLSVIAGSDPLDPATAEADRRKTDYRAALDRNALRSVRIGVWHPSRGTHADVDRVFQAALDVLQAQGAVLVDLPAVDAAVTQQLNATNTPALQSEFKAALNAYLATTPPAVKTRTLEALIAFNAAEPKETPLFGQEIFEASQRSLDITDPAHIERRNTLRRLAVETLDKWLAGQDVAAVVAPSGGPAFVYGQTAINIASPARLPAVAGYPHLTVPMGEVGGLPIGLSFIGAKWSDAKVLSLGYAYEQASRARRNPTFPATLSDR